MGATHRFLFRHSLFRQLLFRQFIFGRKSIHASDVLLSYVLPLALIYCCYKTSTIVLRFARRPRPVIPIRGKAQHYFRGRAEAKAVGSAYFGQMRISHTFPAYPLYVRIFPAYFCTFSFIVGVYLGIFQIFFAHISCLYTAHIWEIVTRFSGFPRYVTHSHRVTGFPA